MRWRRLFAGCFSVVAVAASPAVAGAAPHYYLSLGDSLAQGVQPDPAGTSIETNVGYPEQLYALLAPRYPGLRLVKHGCPGESTTSMITGKGNRAAVVARCRPAGGSQLNAALRFLARHHNPGEVPLVTIDIGANDVDGCLQNGNLNVTCLNDGEKAIAKNEPKIVKRLRAAAPKGTKIVGMTFYDPFLAGYLQGGNARLLALASVGLAKTINGNIAAAYGFPGGKLADVAKAFATDDQTDLTTLPNGVTVPLDVGRICALTWACTPAPQGPNIHANKAGYALIAQTFATAIGNLTFG